MEKLYFKVYQDKYCTDFNYFVATYEEAVSEIEAVFKNGVTELLPVLEPVYMTEDEYNALPPFEGY